MKSAEQPKPMVQFYALATLVLLILAVPGCSQDASNPVKKAQKVELYEAVVKGGGSTTQPNLHSDVLPWLIDALDLKKTGFESFRITKYDVSPDGRYVAINISNGKATEPPGPLYRFVIFDSKEKRILFPSKEVHLRDDLGYPYVAAKFRDNNLIAIAYGYRNIIASVVSLPDGEVIRRQELYVSSVENISEELFVLLESAAGHSAIGKTKAHACDVLRERKKILIKEVRDYYSFALNNELTVESDYKVLPSDFRLNKDEIRSTDCIEDVGPDDCSGDMMTASFFDDHVYRDYGTGREVIYTGDFGQLSSRIYQNMSQDELINILGKPYRKNAFVMTYKTISEFEDRSPEEQLFFYFKNDELFAASNSNGSGC